MTGFSVMVRARRGGRRLLGAAVGVAVAATGAFAAPASAASGGGVGTPAPMTTTTLPPLPKVSPEYTAGKSPQALLSEAISLSSLGLDNSALTAAVAATQVRLDADALTARKALQQSEAAARLEAEAQASEAAASAQYATMAGAVRQAVLYMYTKGSGSITISPSAGRLAIYAEDYAASTIGPYGVLARRRTVAQQRAEAMRGIEKEAHLQATAAARASKALADEKAQLSRLQSELALASTASAAAMAVDHFVLAVEAGKELRANSGLEFTPKAPLPVPVSTTPVALTWAFAELGRQYVWGATGPTTFDCSGLTQFVWKAAGVSIPRVAADQDGWTVPVPLSQLLPGDLVFFGTTDIHHVGIYIGGGLMINAPHTGTVVQVGSIWWSDLAGFGRVHYPGTPVPPHNTPTPAQPATPAVLPSAGPVPSQVQPPVGWKPKPGSSPPVHLGIPSISILAPRTTSTTSTTVTTAPSTATTLAPAVTTTVPLVSGAPTTTTTSGAGGQAPTGTESSSIPATG